MGCAFSVQSVGRFVWTTEEEMQAMADSLNIPLDLFKRKYTRRRFNRYSLIEKRAENNACVFLKDKKCMVYKVRPKQCRTFPWWKSNLNSEESWKIASLSCEGINDKAPVVPYSEIVQLLSLNDQDS